MPLETREVQCPYCGETNELEIEVLKETQDFIEDCAACCRPIEYSVVPGIDGPEVTASRTD